MKKQTDAQPYEWDPFLKSMTATIVDAGDDDRPWVELEETLFYPEGGGQPADRGWINGVEVLDVQKVNGKIRHFLSSPVATGPADLELDWDRRFDHMQQHTGQHLLTALSSDEYGWKTTAFHLGEHVCDIEVDGADLSREALDRLEERVAEEIRAARRVTGRRVSAEEFATLEVRTRGLPKGHEGSIRLVEIEGIDLNTCGGTHLISTSQLECLKILGAEPMRGGSRIHYIAGARVRRRLSGHEERNARLRGLLGTADEELPETVSIKLEQLKEGLRRIRRLEDELASSLGESLGARPSPVVWSHFEAMDMGFLQKVARVAGAGAAPQLFLLTASVKNSPEEGFFALAATASAHVDLRQIGPRVAEVLGGRGGGTSLLFQGKGQTISKRGQARALLQEWWGERKSG